MTRPVVTVRSRKLGRKFLAAEAWWILTGRNDVASIAPYSKDISKFSNDGRRFDGAYGPRVVDQLRYVCDALINDKDTRQAVMTIWRSNPQPSKDIPCTVACQWMIRQRGSVRRLHCVDTMRSSDAWLGWPYDVFNFSMLSTLILLTIRERDESLKDVQLGSLILQAGSQHLYETDFHGVEKLFEAPEYDEYAPLDLNDFANPEELVESLACRKGDVPVRLFNGLTWMSELY